MRSAVPEESKALLVIENKLKPKDPRFVPGLKIVTDYISNSVKKDKGD